MSRKGKREQWKSRFGFIWAAIGSAIGLGSIWRFPYVVGEHGGAGFVLIYLICLILVGFPVLMCEMIIGRKVQLNPASAFKKLGRGALWGGIGKLTIVTGFLVSSFYAVVSSWTFGYLLQSFLGQLTSLATFEQAHSHFISLRASPYSSLFLLLFFVFLAVLVLYTGVSKGIEVGNKIMMPLLFIVLLILAFKGLRMPGGSKGLSFIFLPDWSRVTPNTILVALGQAFFSLSLGQGTMTTYGSYIKRRENLPSTCLPIALFGVCVSLLAGVAIFAIVFSFGMPPTAGESLMFETLPIIFSRITGGYLFCLLFFLLIFLAALSSQISAMEPLIAYLVDIRKWNRSKAAFLTGLGVFLVGIPCALSFGLLSHVTFLGKTIFDALLSLCINVLIPCGGLAALILVGWKWGMKKGIAHLREGAEPLFEKHPMIENYFRVSIRYIAPLLIFLIILDTVGVFN